MESIFICAVYVVIFAAIPVAKRLRTRALVESLCLACVNAVVTRGTNGKTLVACNFGGAMRPVKFEVCQCSGFCTNAKPAKLVTIEGFVSDKREAYAEVAIERVSG